MLSVLIFCHSAPMFGRGSDSTDSPCPFLHILLVQKFLEKFFILKTQNNKLSTFDVKKHAVREKMMLYFRRCCLLAAGS